MYQKQSRVRWFEEVHTGRQSKPTWIWDTKTITNIPLPFLQWEIRTLIITVKKSNNIICSVVSDSLGPMDGSMPSSVPGILSKNTAVGSHSLFQGIFWPRNEPNSPALQTHSCYWVTDWVYNEVLAYMYF